MERNGWSSPFRRSREDPMSAMRVYRLGTGTVPFFCHSSALWGSDVSGRKGRRYSPECVEGEFSEVRASGVLGTPPLAKNLDAFSRPSLPGLHPLTVASDIISLCRVGGSSAGATTPHVLGGGGVPRLEDVPATPPVE